MTTGTGSGWAEYYAWSSGREPRPLLLAACEQLGAGAGRMAVDLGCGDGTDALALLDRGWSVLAVDAEPAGLDLFRARIPAAWRPRVQIVRASFAEAVLPSAYLIHAGFSLPFCPPGQFRDVWRRIRAAVVPGGIFGGQLFGPRDSWAREPSMNFHTRAEVNRLLDGLEVLELRETDQDGHASTGPKHWHLYDILARVPGGQSEIAPATG